jgi:hypothetical protein
LTFVLGITTFLRGIADARGVPVDEDLFLLVLFIVGLLITLISFLRIRKAGGPRFAAHYDPFLVVGVTLISAWIGIFMMSIAVQVIGEVVIDAQPAPPANSQTVPGIIFPPVNDQIVAGTMLLFVGSFIVGVPAGLSVEPPLPTVEVTKMNGHSAIRGRLVSHSEGFWHLFVEPNSEVSYELLAIPDSEVLTVRIIGAADANRAEVAKVNAERDTERDK